MCISCRDFTKLLLPTEDRLVRVLSPTVGVDVERAVCAVVQALDSVRLAPEPGPVLGPFKVLVVVARCGRLCLLQGCVGCCLAGLLVVQAVELLGLQVVQVACGQHRARVGEISLEHVGHCGADELAHLLIVALEGHRKLVARLEVVALVVV